MKKLAIIGYPVSHSFSPAMHNFISERINAPYSYSAVEVLPGEVKEAVLKLKADGICGFNVTAPHKFAIMECLDEISEDARRYGSVNTVVNKNGRLYGYNTDAEGFYMSLRYNGINPENKHILILGAGGAAQPVALNLAEKGAASLTVKNRTQEKAEQLKKYIKDCIDYEIETQIKREHYDIVINCTSLGMGDNKHLSAMENMSLINEKTVAVDMIYNPAETVFLKNAKDKGAKTLNGLGMLIFQGILAYRLFTGIDIADSMADEILKGVFNR